MSIKGEEYIYIYIHIYIHTYMCIYLERERETGMVCLREICIPLHICVYVHVHADMCVYIYVHIYIHTYS